MENSPTFVVVSCSNTKPKSLIKLLTKSTVLNEENEQLGKISHPWIIDTKYYTAEILVVGLDKHYERSEDFNNSVEALLIHMDSNRSSGLDDLSVWENLDKDCSPEVKLLVANYCTDATKITKTKAVEWCLKRGFEFVELYPSNVPTPDEEADIIPEKFGVDRIVEALQTHAWSNLVMKPKAKPGTTEKEPSERMADEILETGDDFSELFSQLQMMKDSIHSLPMSQRKQSAEQMVTAFWQAIGGEEEEILDI